MPKLAYRTTNPNPNDTAIAQRFSDAIRAGHPVATAAVLAGISERTARRYLAQGRDEAEQEQGSPCLFWRMFKEAEADFVESQLQRIHRDADAKGGWAAAMTLLERRRPQDFGRNQRIEIEQHSISANVMPELTDAQQAMMLRLLTEDTPLLPPPPTAPQLNEPHGLSD